VTLTVINILRRAHISRKTLDDKMAHRWLDNFLKSLDPMKVYFYQSDVDQFRTREKDMDDQALQGNIQIGYDIFRVYLKRVEERAKLADEFIELPHDFTVDETMVSNPDVAHYSRTPEEARETWRKRIKYDLLLLKADGTKMEDARDRIHRRYRSFAKRMLLTSPDDLLELYLSAMTTAYDPHTTYMSPENFENFRIMIGLNLDGIGASLRFEDGYTIVSEIVPGGAADRDGRLKPEDRVVGVGQGEDGEIEDVVDMRLSDVVGKIRGPRGTIVRLEVIPDKGTERVIIPIKRDRIELKGSEARGEIIQYGKKADGNPYNIGVINLPSFYMDMEAAQAKRPDYKSTTRDVLKIINDPVTGFKAKGVDVIVMDLRNNGGGSLKEALNLTGLFIDQRPVVQVKDFEGNVEQLEPDAPGVAWDGPLVVLTNHLSASASEIFAAAIQDYNRGLVLGDLSTHGKGTVQSLLDLGERLFPGPNPPALGALKLTMQQFYRPNGDSTQLRGVLADIELPSITSQMDIGEKSLDFAMEFDNVPAARYAKTNYVNDGIRSKLRVLSSQRIAQNKDFQKVLHDVQVYLTRKDRKEVTLNEAKFLEERKEFETDDEKKKDDENNGLHNRPVVERNFYLDECLNITMDYLQILNVAKAD